MSVWREGKRGGKAAGTWQNASAVFEVRLAGVFVGGVFRFCVSIWVIECCSGGGVLLCTFLCLYCMVRKGLKEVLFSSVCVFTRCWCP